MRKFNVAAAVVFAACSVPAWSADAWVKSTRADDNSCSIADLNLEMTPFYKGKQINISAWGSQLLIANERDVGLEFRFEDGGSVPSFTFYLVLPHEGLYTDGTAGVRLIVDGELVRSSLPEVEPAISSVALVRWLAADRKAAAAAVAKGKAAKIEFLGDKKQVLRIREIDLAPLRRGIAAIQTARWTC
jgi:hypothetical protein